MRVRLVPLILAGLCAAFATSAARAHTYKQVGVDSNFLIDDGKVYFAQSDGSLTALDLDTGAVLARRRHIRYRGILRRVEPGILVHATDGITVVDTSSLDVLWRSSDQYNVTVAADRVIAGNGHGLLTCRALDTGEPLWSYDLPGSLDVVLEKDRVLVFRSAVYGGPKGEPAVVLLDLQSGRELLRKTTPPGVHYLRAYFDGDRIYLPCGSYEGQYTRNVSRFDQGRPSTRFERLLVWDLDGVEIQSIPAPVGLDRETQDMDETFVLGGKAFARGRVWASADEVPPWWPGHERSREIETSDDSRYRITITEFGLDDGRVRVTVAIPFRSLRGRNAEKTCTVELESSHGAWRGRLPYLANAGTVTVASRETGTVAVVGATDDILLLGSDFGHVEAIERESGKSLWMYVFATRRHTMSYSTSGMPPSRASAAKQYEQDNERKEPESGLVLEGSLEVSRPTIVLDPDPGDA